MLIEDNNNDLQDSGSESSSNDEAAVNAAKLNAEEEERKKEEEKNNNKTAGNSEAMPEGAYTKNTKYGRLMFVPQKRKGKGGQEGASSEEGPDVENEGEEMDNEPEEWTTIDDREGLKVETQFVGVSNNQEEPQKDSPENESAIEGGNAAENGVDASKKRGNEGDSKEEGPRKKSKGGAQEGKEGGAQEEGSWASMVRGRQAAAQAKSGGRE